MEAGDLMKLIMARLSITPFESAIAILLIGGGVAEWFHITQQSVIVLPSWETYTLDAMSIVSGLLMLHGCAAATRRTEAAGLLMLLAVILSRLVLYLTLLRSPGLIAVSMVFYMAVVAAAVSRLITLRKGEVIMRIRRQLCTRLLRHRAAE
jgi:hypothetical protein